ncbi:MULTISPECIES: hypothetical protein [unclassified Paracoccus (in: a-proteobacteria)]|uniref:hypothetical protein n=1 Tax=unclassified Paracoccus (in: a-proteobacteria) TaxID=2688777 RepID=UPI0021E1A658|nr:MULTISPECIES: hypothetical protein [unclassified Paracoccus (in: a-proteobacteria)]UXU73959.1 hypothetical protein GB879_008480 [Paracoccus sp. SMMA_5]UXU79846.1 hypothetical protein GB880_008460 [Paracoccus sp. SMMA_5_TC]
MSLDPVTEYALSFSEDAVHLQRRERPALGAVVRPQAWRHLGSVDFDSASFREELMRLRSMAGAESSAAALPVTVIIPDDQILYTDLAVAEGPGRGQAVARALDGLTPYPVAELAFDWAGQGEKVRVAAVACQTLREARDFAQQYGFAAQQYSADPAPEQFPAAPRFDLPDLPEEAGPTPAAAIAPSQDSVADTDLDLRADGVNQAVPADAAQNAAPAQPDHVVAGDLVVTRIPPHPLTDHSALPTPSPTVPLEVPQPAPAGDATPHFAEQPDTEAAVLRARPLGAADAAGRRVPTTGRGGLTGLVAMLGALVLGLVLIWAFLGPRDRQMPEQVAAIAAPEADAVENTPLADTEPAPPIGADAASATVDAPAPSSSSQSAEAAPSQAPAPSALTEAERRRVMVAAAAVAAAVVPPAAHTPSQPVTPAPSAQETRAEAAQLPAPAQSPAAPAQTATPEQTATPLPASAASAPGASAPPSAPARAAQAETPVTAQPRASQAARPRSAPATQAAATSRQVAAASPGLSRSARPQVAPRRSAPQTSVPREDSAPRVPGNPIPYEASQRQPQILAGTRPPARRAVIQPQAQGGAQGQPAAAEPQAQPRGPVAASGRPPQRPEGSMPELPPAQQDDAQLLTPQERAQLRALAQDLRLHVVMTVAPIQETTRWAQARPLRKPLTGAAPATASDAGQPAAIDAAVRAANAPPPDRPERAASAATPARDSGGLLRASARPRPRPGNAAGNAGSAAASAASLSGGAVEAAIAAAVEASPSTPGAVQLSALTSSAIPPRRSENRSGPAPAPDAAAPATTLPGDATAAAAAAAPVAPAAAPGPSEAELAARRALDEQLQAQAEARIRARAAADARAEAQARAQAEARARAQAEAEERAARARRQEYRPPEVDNEPEIAAAALSRGSSSATVAKAATQSRGIDLGRTTIIGIIGAGNASRALIRLRNGRVVTVRLGDRIDGGTINSIGDGRITYVKAGQVRELRMLDGR